MTAKNLEWIFSFGGLDVHPESGEFLKDRFVRIRAEDAEHARQVMVLHFGKKWGFQYRTEHDAGVERFGLKELPQTEWPAARQ